MYDHYFYGGRPESCLGHPYCRGISFSEPLIIIRRLP